MLPLTTCLAATLLHSKMLFLLQSTYQNIIVPLQSAHDCTEIEERWIMDLLKKKKMGSFE